jgi:hypothetical protein
MTRSACYSTCCEHIVSLRRHYNYNWPLYNAAISYQWKLLTSLNKVRFFVEPPTFWGKSAALIKFLTVVIFSQTHPTQFQPRVTITLWLLPQEALKMCSDCFSMDCSINLSREACRENVLFEWNPDRYVSTYPPINVLNHTKLFHSNSVGPKRDIRI